MKNLLKIIILIAITFMPKGVFAQESVIKDFSAPKSTVNKFDEKNKPRKAVTTTTKKTEAVNKPKNVAVINLNKATTKTAIKTVAVIKLKAPETKNKTQKTQAVAKKTETRTVSKKSNAINPTKTANKNKSKNIATLKTAAKTKLQNVNSAAIKKAGNSNKSTQKVLVNTNKKEEKVSVKNLTNTNSNTLNIKNKDQTIPLGINRNEVNPAQATSIGTPCSCSNTPLIPQDATHPPAEYIYKETSAKIDNIDPTAETATTTYYPGLRGTNQLIIYTPSYGSRTGTNEFGTEAIVTNNTVLQLNGADSIIPNNGFVISGHGTAKKWINENATVGSKIFVDVQNNKVRSYLTPDSFIFAAKEKIKEANSIMDYYSSIDVLYDNKAAEEYILKSKDLLRKAEKDPDNAQIHITQAMDYANLAIKSAIPYKNDELKGVWLRPTETSPQEIIRTIEKLQSIGINNIFLETYFHGKTIYPSQVLASYGVTNQKEEFVGFDPLRIWVDECHKRNMKVHVWFETFYVGNQPPAGNAKHVLTVHPSWANTTKAGYASTTPVASLSEHNGYFIDPANPEVQKYLLDILNEIITNYCPDGINLDYIRYPQSIAAKFNNYDMTNWGYTKYARDEFKNLYNMEPLDLKYNNDGWDLWARYRQDKITKFVAETKKLTSANNILLTTVIFPDRQKSLEVKMQDWRTWSLNNLIDGFTPLILTSDKITAASMIGDIKANAGPCTKVFPGLFVTFMGGSIDDLLMQIQEARKACANGIIIFDYAHLDPKYIDALTTRVYNQSTQYSTPKPQRYLPQRQKRFKFRWSRY